MFSRDIYLSELFGVIVHDADVIIVTCIIVAAIYHLHSRTPHFVELWGRTNEFRGFSRHLRRTGGPTAVPGIFNFLGMQRRPYLPPSGAQPPRLLNKYKHRGQEHVLDLSTSCVGLEGCGGTGGSLCGFFNNRLLSVLLSGLGNTPLELLHSASPSPKLCCPLASSLCLCLVLLPIQHLNTKKHPQTYTKRAKSREALQVPVRGGRDSFTQN